MANPVFSNITNRCYDDRFIPNRSNIDVDRAHYKLRYLNNNSDRIKKDIFDIEPKKLGRYKNLLHNSLNYDESDIYCFNKDRKQEKMKNRKSLDISSLWPCSPRKYPVLHKPETVLDWPRTQDHKYWNLLDWGSNGYLATIWSGNVFLWKNLGHREDEIINTKIRACGALKWNHAGTQLAVGGFAGNFTVWSFPQTKELCSGSCYIPAFQTCVILVFAWDLTDTILVSGCSEGYLYSWDIEKVSKYNMKATKFVFRNNINAHKGHRVLALAFDSSNRYLCSSGMDSVIRIWAWPDFVPQVQITYCSPVKAIAFHPWRASLLAVGGGLYDGSLAIWNVATCTRVGYYVPERDSMVDSISWSSKTGELVSGHRLFNKRSNGRSRKETYKLLVLADLENVVDYINGQARIMYLLWDKTGTKLATATEDECLYIWNFLGKKTNSSDSVLHRNYICGQSKDSVLNKMENYIR